MSVIRFIYRKEGKNNSIRLGGYSGFYGGETGHRRKNDCPFDDRNPLCQELGLLDNSLGNSGTTKGTG